MSTLSDLHDAISRCLEAVKCDDCGSELTIVSRKVDTYLDLTVSVEPCATCIRAAEDRGETGR